MYSGVPNFVFVFGYTNASWTLKADLACAFLCRLLTHMDYNQYSAVTPIKDPNVQDEHLTDFTSGYFQRSQQFMPKQGSTHPWKIHMNYILDYFILAWRSMENDSLKYTRAQLSAKLWPNGQCSYPSKNVFRSYMTYGERRTNSQGMNGMDLEEYEY